MGWLPKFGAAAVGAAMLLCCTTAGFADMFGETADQPIRVAVSSAGELRTMTTVPGAQMLDETAFTVDSEGRLSVQSGPGWTDGEVLYESEEPMGTVTVMKRLAEQDADFEHLDYVYFFFLEGCGEPQCRALEFTEELESQQGWYTLQCQFYGLPEGTYRVYEEDGVAVSVTITGEHLEQVVWF